jgi:Zn-dependent M28 family amino/carboxypeptidase
MPTLPSCTSFFRYGSALALALLVTTAEAAQAAPKPSFSPAEKAAMARITAAEISGHTRFLADDLLEGRFPGSRGEMVGIRYLATQLETMGYQPGVPGQDGKPASWFQAVPLVKYTTTIPADITFKRGAESLVLPTGPGLKAEVAVRSIGDTDDVDVRNAGLVFVGYGIVAPEFGWDDYRGIDVKGKIVVLLNFNPPFAGEGVRLWYGRWDYKFAEAARHGAAGALLVHTTESASYPWQVVVSSNRPEAFALPPEGEARLDFQGWVSREGVGKLFQLAGRDFAAAEIAAKDPKTKGAPSLPLGVTASLDMPVKRERIESANVIGVLPGTDPKLKAEAVLYTAHHDHLGQRIPPAPGERNVYSGALDNASGCAVVLTVARAAAASPPKRSIVVAFVTAEEQGLLGSRYFAQHPTLPVGRIAVDINLDGINNKGRTSDLGVIGLGKSTVDDVIRSLAAAQGRTVHGDPYLDRGFFYRSDSFELAQVGVPSARIGGGPHYVGRPENWGKEQQELYEHHDYHQPSDAYPPSPEAWDLTGAVEDAQLQLLLGLRIGNTPAMPTWTKGDEFEKYRLAALSSVPAPVLRKPLPERVPETGDATVIGEVPAKVLDTVKADLAKRTGAKAEAMSVIRSEELVFSDGSLGCGRPGKMSTQALVPGYRVVLALAGKQYDYRVTRQGAFTLCEQGPRSR